MERKQRFGTTARRYCVIQIWWECFHLRSASKISPLYVNELKRGKNTWITIAGCSMGLEYVVTELYAATDEMLRAESHWSKIKKGSMPLTWMSTIFLERATLIFLRKNYFFIFREWSLLPIWTSVYTNYCNNEDNKTLKPATFAYYGIGCHCILSDCTTLLLMAAHGGLMKLPCSIFGKWRSSE